MAKGMVTNLAQLRARHIACVTWNDINRDIRAGRVPGAILDKWRQKGTMGPGCSEPFDIFCAAPVICDEDVLEAIHAYQSRVGGE